MGWIEKSGLKKKKKDEGFSLRWSRPEKIESHKLDGYDVVYEFDKIKRVKRKIVTGNRNEVELILIEKKTDLIEGIDGKENCR